jgi:hypothetical protein
MDFSEFDAIAWALVIVVTACEAVGVLAVIGLFLPIRPPRAHDASRPKAEQSRRAILDQP